MEHEVIIAAAETLDKIVDKITLRKEIGFAGIKTRDFLEESLRFWKVGGKSSYFVNGNKERIKTIIRDTLKKCEAYVKEKVYFFVFPTSDEFITDKMKGSSGVTVYDNVAWIFLAPASEWELSLANTVVHELTHEITNYYVGNDKNYKLGEALVHDGLAENFREFILGKDDMLTKVIKKREADKIIKELKPILEHEDTMMLHNRIFFGTDRYPMWAGYTIGYNIVKDFLKKKYPNGKPDWNAVFEAARINPGIIIKGALEPEVKDNNS